MSFASDIKKETARGIAEKRCCKLAEISGFIRAAGSITLAGRGRAGIVMGTGHPAVARHYKTLITEVFGVSPALMVGESDFQPVRHIYRLNISAEKGGERILETVGVLGRDGDGLIFRETLDESRIRNKCCRRACLRGVFLGVGTMNQPDRGYHLEMAVDGDAFAGSIRRLVNSFTGIHSKIGRRRNKYIVYLKNAEQIRDFLGIIGAHSQLFKFEDTRVLKEVRNRTNRINNCDAANMDRALRAAARQTELIRRLQRAAVLDDLPGDLLDTALVRLDHPEASLAELGELLNPPLSKGAVAGRMKKITEFAKIMIE